MNNPLWYRDDVQFPRLLSEIRASGNLDWKFLEESMDLSRSKLIELFDRAEKSWELIKQEHCPVGNGHCMKGQHE